MALKEPMFMEIRRGYSGPVPEKLQVGGLELPSGLIHKNLVVLWVECENSGSDKTPGRQFVCRSSWMCDLSISTA